MKSNSGAGASVSSGADYQARVAASILAMAICGMSTDFICPEEIKIMSFETAEEIDDIVLETNTGRSVYIQTKVNISFSLSKNGDLKSVLSQFKSQHCLNGKDSDIYILATSMRSSKKVIYDLRTALNAYSSCESRFFFREKWVRKTGP